MRANEMNEQSKTFFSIDPEQCERLNRTEMNSMNWMLAAVNAVAYAQTDLAERMKMIPDGPKRMNDTLEMLRSVTNDLIGTVPLKQCVRIKNTMHDMELRLVPKMAAKDVRVVLSKDEAKDLVDSAQELCKTCTKDGEECKDCQLYKVLTAVLPLDDYGLGLLCPYNMAGWGDE